MSLHTKSTDSLKVLFLCREPHPTPRVDVAVLFGKYLPRCGVGSDLVAADAEPYRTESAPWPAGQARTNRVTGNRVKNALATFTWGVRELLRANSATYDLIVVRDNPMLAATAVLLRPWKKIPACYWMSFPIDQGHLRLARLGWRRLGVPRWIFAWIKGLFSSALLYRVALKYSDHSFVQSQFMVDWLVGKGIARDSMTPVPMGVDVEQIAGMPDEDAVAAQVEGYRLVVHLGSFDPVRRVDPIIEAMPLVLARFPDALLVMVGATADRVEDARLRRLADQLGVAHRVIWTGWVEMPRAWSYVRRAAMGLSFIPRGELFDFASPTKLVEYLALGVPAVVNDLPDQVLVANESSGAIVEEMSPEGVARGVITLLADPTRSHEMGRKGKEYVARERSYESLARRVAGQMWRITRVSAGQ